MEPIYFSKTNFNIVYDILQKRCQKQHGIDITRDPRFHQELVNIMKSVHQNRSTLNYKAGLPPIEESKIVTQRSIDVATSYFNDMISKSRQNPTRREQVYSSGPGPTRNMGSAPSTPNMMSMS